MARRQLSRCRTRCIRPHSPVRRACLVPMPEPWRTGRTGVDTLSSSRLLSDESMESTSSVSSSVSSVSSRSVVCLLRRARTSMLGGKHVAGWGAGAKPPSAPQRELRARGLVVRRELTPFSATGFGARCWRHKTEGGRAKKTSTVAEWGATESLLRRMHAKTPVPAGQDTETEGKLPNGVVLSVVCAASGAMLVLFCLSARSGAAPGRPEAIIFDQSAESAGTPAPVAGLLAGQQGWDLETQPDGRERAQHVAEAAQREAEEAMQDQIDAVAKAEDGVNALTGTPPPVLSEAEEAQRDLEQAQAEREAAQVAKETKILDAEEKARLEAETEAEANRAGRAGDMPTVGKTDLSNSTRAADTASARAEDAPRRTSAPAASAGAKASAALRLRCLQLLVRGGPSFRQSASRCLPLWAMRCMRRKRLRRILHGLLASHYGRLPSSASARSPCVCVACTCAAGRTTR